MSTPGNQTVFFAGDKPDPSDSTHSPIPSIEDNHLVQVVSDIMDGEDNIEEGDSGTRANSRDSTVTEEVPASPPPAEDGEVADKKPKKPLKGKRQRAKRTSAVRRSSRISSVVPPKKAGPLAVKAPVKRGRGRPPSKAKTAQSAAQKEWEVEKVVGSQVDAVTSERFYLVKWKGYSVKDNTWEPKKNLGNCHNLIRDFEKVMSK